MEYLFSENIVCFLIMVFLVVLNISCSSSKEESHSKQINTANTLAVPTAQEKMASKDTTPSTTSQNFISTVSDTITGVLYVTGNEPFTKFGLQTSNGTMYILKCTKEIESDLRTKQGKIINVYYDGREQIPEGQVLRVLKIEYQNQPIVK
jgi:hypothetical protein